MRRIEGAYSLAIMTERELVGVRDPYGFRPLSIGKVDDAWVLASETCAFDLIHAEFVRDVEPGEIVIIDRNGLRSIQAFPEQERRAFCIFEYVYFARPDSTIANRNVYKVRVEMGRQLAREHPIEADLVIPVPDSGNCAALGYSLESGIPYEMAFVRNHYVGRSFLQPSQLIRDFDVRVKLNLISDLVKGKRVIVVDDSIVRGTTSKSRVNNLKEAGAREVHVMVSCPPHKHPCVYGIDFPDRSKLMAANHSQEEIRKYLNADSLSYLVKRRHGQGDRPARKAPFAWPVTTAIIPWRTTRWWTSTSWNRAARARMAWARNCPAKNSRRNCCKGHPVVRIRRLNSLARFVPV